MDAAFLSSHTCPACGGRKSLRATKCQRCHLTAIAPLGYQATAKKYGNDFAITFIKAHLDTHPSNLEQIVAAWLRELEVEFMTNWRVKCTRKGKKVNYLIDFVVTFDDAAPAVIIEVDGEWAHQFHHERDAHKHMILARRFGRTNVVHLTDTTIANGTGRQQLEAAIQRASSTVQ